MVVEPLVTGLLIAGAFGLWNMVDDAIEANKAAKLEEARQIRIANRKEKREAGTMDEYLEQIKAKVKHNQRVREELYGGKMPPVKPPKPEHVYIDED